MARDDLESLIKAMNAMPKAVRKAVQPAIAKGADELVARMKYLAPVEAQDGGASIRKEPGPQPLSATVTAGGPTTTGKTALGRELINEE